MKNYLYIGDFSMKVPKGCSQINAVRCDDCGEILHRSGQLDIAQCHCSMWNATTGERLKK